MSASTRRRRPAVPDAREWVSFEDPSEARTWLVDVTFLESGWNCIYGRGCQGVLTGPAAELEQGCCSYGAHFTGEEDQRRVETAARALTAAQWQFRDHARRKGGPLRRPKAGRSGEVTSRLVGGACIFLNRPGFPGGAGCALHRAALERGVPPLSLKPDVCWQLPFRREDSTGPDGHITTTLGEWNRHHWGKGGAEFAWWCTEAPEAFRGAAPVYLSNRDELVAMVGKGVYKLIATYIGSRERQNGASVRLPHPAVRRP